MPGPNPTPSNIKKLSGSWRANLNPNEPRPMIGKFSAPAHFNEEEKKAWDDMSDILYRMGVLTEADLMSLEQLIVSWVIYRDSVRLIRERGTTIVIETKTGQQYEQTAPWVALAKSSLADLLKLQDRFGLSPSARTKIQAQKMEDAQEDVLQSLLRGK